MKYILKAAWKKLVKMLWSQNSNDISYNTVLSFVSLISKIVN